MCGVGGVLGDMTGIDGAALLAGLAHRGPDHRAQLAVAPGVWLCAARLAIRDPSAAGHQPMRSEDGTHVLVYNGEVYNAASLRDELGAQGHRFRSQSDTEVVLEGYRAWGGDIVARLDGMFAFALWDGVRGRLLLARDPLGIKPLWIATAAAGPGRRRLAFASEVRALLDARAAERSIDPRAVATLLAAGSVAEPRAIVRGVEALPPGCTMVVERDGLVERHARYWSLPPDGAPPLPDARAASVVRERLECSVAAHLESDVPLGLLLSGGIDSAVIAILAARHRRGVLRAFHVRGSEAAARRARALAASLDLPFEEVDPEPSPDAMLAAIAAQDQPAVDGANAFLIARAIARAGLKAALTGLGADELFLGYPLHRHYLRARALQARLGPVASPLRALAGRAGALIAGGTLAAPWRVEKLVALAAAEGSGPSAYAALRSLFPAASARRLLPDAPPADDPPEVAADSPASQVSRFELTGYLVNTLLRDADVMSMAHGVELRVPLLDRRLVETVVALGGAAKLAPGRHKPLLCDAVPELPPELAAAPKEGFVLPLERWLLGPLRATVADTLASRDAARRVGVDGPAVERVWARFLRSPDSGAAHRVWALFALLRWAEAHRVSA